MYKSSKLNLNLADSQSYHYLIAMPKAPCDNQLACKLLFKRLMATNLTVRSINVNYAVRSVRRTKACTPI